MFRVPCRKCEKKFWRESYYNKLCPTCQKRAKDAARLSALICRKKMAIEYWKGFISRNAQHPLRSHSEMFIRIRDLRKDIQKDKKKLETLRR